MQTFKAIFAVAFAVGSASGSFAAEAEPAPVPAGPALPVTIEAAPMQLTRTAQQHSAVLPTNTEVLLSVNQEITTKGKTWEEGDTFDLSVVHDVLYGDYVVIPKGSRGVGRITWMTDKGMFGKSGKMDVALEYVQVNGRRIPLTGTYRQEGEGNTVATIGAVVVAPIVGFFVTGKSGVIPQGRELMARTKEDLPLAFDGPPPSNAFRVGTPAPAVVASAVSVSTPAPAEAAIATQWKLHEAKS